MVINFFTLRNYDPLYVCEKLRDLKFKWEMADPC